ncbi:phage tail spike protein [Staphylococcus saprophyticus]|nr:phage tail spike protein [Staphylococcus saprophyticus]
MIHVLDFNDNIIDYISEKNNYVTNASLVRSKEENTDTYDFVIDSDRAENLRERHRIIVQDRNDIYREYIIVNVSDDIDDQTTVQCNASYVEDLTTAKPYAPGGFTKYTTTQALDDITKDTGWETDDDTEYGGIRSSSWTSYQTRYAVAQQMCTTYDMELDFRVELSSNTVAHRYVSLKSKNSLFKGKEIKFGKDLLSMTRTVDISELHTALLAIGPESESGDRKEIIVTDDDAQSQFGLDKRYIWGIYEPESDDTEMTEERLTTLARTQLNKDKQAAISYEITSTDISKIAPHEIINFGDTVRIKDTEFNPPLYVEAEVIGETYNPIAKESEFTFGNVKEFKADELRKDLYDRLSEIQKKMNDNITNVNTIVGDVVAGQLEYFERKIIKSDTPPENPVNDMMWYDTSNPEVAVLRRYWNGEWLEQTADDVEKIGGITREKALYSELTNTFTNLSIQHAKLQSDVYEVVTNEYLVDDELKAAVNNAYNETTKVFDSIKTNLDSVEPETATIGKLVDTQALFLKYRERMQALYKTIESAKIAIDKRFKLLQSQYTDEKFNNAMEQIAATLPNGVWDSTNMQLSSDIPNQQQLEELRTSIQAYTDGNLSDLKDLLTQTIDSKINVAKDEISASVTSLQNEINGIEIGTVNLLRSYTPEFNQLISPVISDTKEFIYTGWGSDLYDSLYINQKLVPDETYTISYDIEVVGLSEKQVAATGCGIILFDRSTQDYAMRSRKNLPREIGYTEHIKETFVMKNGDYDLICYSNLLSDDGNTTTKPLDYDTIKVKNLQLKKGTVETDYSPAPEDNEYKIAQAQQQATDAAKAYADAQDELKAIEVQAYADGVVDAEEQRAIKDATDKLNAAKTYAETKATEAKNAAITDAANKLKPITTRVTTSESNIKILQDGLKLTATKTEVEQKLNDKLTPIQNQVNEQKATLDILPNQIASKVSKSDYTTDQNNIVSRLNSADTERLQLSNQISDRVTLKEYNSMKIGTRNLLLDSLSNNNFTDSTTYSNVRYTLTRPLEVGKTYTFICDFSVNGELIDGQTTIRPYTPNGNPYTVDIVKGKIKYSFVATVASTEMILYKDIAGIESARNNVLATNAMLAEGNKIGDYEQAPEDTDQHLTTMQTSIDQNGQQIQLKANTTEMNASKKTLSNVIADLTINTTTGLTLKYDENGAISSHVVDKNGVKIRGDKVDISVNKEFQVLAGNVDNKVGKDEVINRLNLSPEGLDINVNKIGIRGGDATNYIRLRNNGLLSYGEFERSWAGDKDTAKLELGINDGRVLVRNQTTGYRLYLTERGLSTMMDGFSDDTSGTLEFHSKRFNTTSRGITMHSTYGAVALLSEQSRIYTRSNLTNNIESFSYGVYIRPYMNTRPGINEFNFYIKDNDGAGNTDGCILFGEVSESKGLAGSGLRFKKAGVRDRSDMESIVYATDNDGNIGTGSFYGHNLYGDWVTKNTNLYASVNGELRITDMKGYNSGNPSYANLRASSINTTHSYAFANHSGSDVYFGVGYNELRITANNWWNGGKPAYQDIRFKNWFSTSSEKYKYDIQKWDYNVLEVLKNDLQLYSFKRDEERDSDYIRNHHGVVLEYETPIEWVHKDGVDNYEMSSWTLKGVQELAHIVDDLQAQLKEQGSRISELEKIIAKEEN